MLRRTGDKPAALTRSRGHIYLSIYIYSSVHRICGYERGEVSNTESGGVSRGGRFEAGATRADEIRIGDREINHRTALTWAQYQLSARSPYYPTFLRTTFRRSM